MALNTPQFGIPTSLVFGVRDFSKDIRQNQADDTRALQNAFKFGTQVYDYAQSRKQANLIEQDENDKKALQDSIAADQAELTKLKEMLASMGGA
ncbi:MAG: hypothetical protein IIT58_10670 [Treponema sp.]|nr:hypothetical protein [Treponema sp.]